MPTSSAGAAPPGGEQDDLHILHAGLLERGEEVGVGVGGSGEVGEEDEHFVGGGGAGEEVGGGAEELFGGAGAGGGFEVVEVAEEGGSVGGEVLGGGAPGGGIGGEDGGFGGVECIDEEAAEFFFGGVEARGAFAAGEHGVGVVEEDDDRCGAAREGAGVAGEKGIGGETESRETREGDGRQQEQRNDE